MSLPRALNVPGSLFVLLSMGAVIDAAGRVGWTRPPVCGSICEVITVPPMKFPL